MLRTNNGACAVECNYTCMNCDHSFFYIKYWRRLIIYIYTKPNKNLLLIAMMVLVQWSACAIIHGITFFPHRRLKKAYNIRMY